MVQVCHYAFYTNIENNVNLSEDYTHGMVVFQRKSCVERYVFMTGFVNCINLGKLVNCDLQFLQFVKI